MRGHFALFFLAFSKWTAKVSLNALGPVLRMSTFSATWNAEKNNVMYFLASLNKEHTPKEARYG
jgi:hypothetical protein